MPEDKDIQDELPKLQNVEDEFNYALDYWQQRDEFINECRLMVHGENEIEVPEAFGYRAVAVHSFMLAGVLNEKVARYLHIPEIQVPVDDPLDPNSREESTNLERAMDRLFYEMEARGDGDTWTRLVADAILLDCGVERIEDIRGSAWANIHESSNRDAYKKEHGPPLRTIYVPLEASFPVFDGPRRIRDFQVEMRSLWSVMNTEKFDKEPFNSFQDYGLYDTDIPLLHMVDDNYHAYYLINDVRTAGETRAINRNDIASRNLTFLYGYKHGLGLSPVNMVGGRFGGWKTDQNRIEIVGRGQLELSQTLDEIYSQVYTNIRARYWPNLNFKVNPELRAYPDPSNPPAPPQINDGESIVTYIGEEIVPIFPAQNDPTVPWFTSMLKEQLSKLGGSSILFGERQPGVETGYHNAQQLAQAEHLDNQIENNLITGAEMRARIVLAYIRSFNEKVWVYGTERVSGENTRTGKYFSIDPKKLTPLPRVSARVRKPKPIDIMSAIRAAREATDDRNGKGPLFSDETTRDELLAMAAPDLELKKIDIERAKRKLMESTILVEKISERLNMGLASKGTPTISPEMLNKADPQLLQALQQMVGSGQEMPGGITPQLLQMISGPGGGVGQGQGGGPGEFNRNNGGTLPTDSQPENRIGEAVSRAQSL